MYLVAWHVMALRWLLLHDFLDFFEARGSTTMKQIRDLMSDQQCTSVRLVCDL
jgi:hypothetical protein